MIAWCMSHPWMTFFIVMFAIEVINNVANNIIRMVLSLNDKSTESVNNDAINVKIE